MSGEDEAVDLRAAGLPARSADEAESAGEEGARTAAERAAEALEGGNREPAFIRMFRTAREILPGDENLGVGGGRPAAASVGDKVSDVIVRYLAERGDGTTVSQQAGLAAVQVWQALADRATGSGREVDATILFTDIIGFSDWVLNAGDEAGLELLRAVAGVVETAVKRRGGRIVKYLGDGHMAVFDDPRAGVDAALDMQEGLTAVEVHGHRPQLRAGLHLGTPQRVGRDFLGTDVNVAARVGAAARGGEVLVSDVLVEGIDTDGLHLKRRRGFRAKGTPPAMKVYCVTRA